jgi:hypothetical protein
VIGSGFNSHQSEITVAELNYSWMGIEGQLTQAVPEPSTWVMLLLGFTGIGFIAHRRSRKGAAIEDSAAFC